MLEKPNLNKPAFKIFPNTAEQITQEKCPTCKEKIKEEDFRDKLSKKEFSISGMCQKCQDKVFG